MRRATLILVLLAALPACVERRIRVTSEPPGALVWVNDREIGRTPVETRFKYHGLYDVRLEMEGYEPLITSARASAPWYEYPGPDLLAEVAPFTVRNTQEWHFELDPVPASGPGSERELIERADELRRETTGDP